MLLSETERVKLIVGLGNPGAEYDGTRHNAGFAAVQQFLAALPAGSFTESHLADSRVFSGKFRGKPLTLQLPLTYMNESGRAVAPLSRRLGLTPREILVISDDLDLPLGRLRLRCGGSDGGHNGLKSIIAETGSAGFNRLRIGIGREDAGKVVDYVLGRFDGPEAEIFQQTAALAAEAVKCVLQQGMASAMNRYNPAPVEKQEQESNR